MTGSSDQRGNFWSMGDTMTKIGQPPGSAQLVADAMRAIGLGDASRALKSASAALNLSPADPEAIFALGLASELAGKVADAERCYATCLKQEPNNHKALARLGRLRLNARRGPEALFLLMRAVALAPEDIDARHFLARAYGLTFRFDEAVKAFEFVNARRPNNPEILSGYARALANAGRTDEALAVYQEAGRLDPGNDAIVQGTASILIDTGRGDEAAKLLRKAIALKPERPGPYEQLARLGQLVGQEFDIAMRNTANPTLTPPDVASFKLAVGTALLRQDRIDEGFIYVSEANGIRDQGSRYDQGRTGALVESVLEAAAAIRSEAAVNVPFDRPLFIMGMPRSGTTLVEEIFAKHSKVFAAGERNTCFEIRVQLLEGKRSYRSALHDLTAEDRQKLREAYLAGLPEQAAEALRVTDKMPDNVWNLPVIRSLFPGARILICRRNPLDVVWSIFEQGFGRQVAYASNLDNIAWHLRAEDRVINQWLAQDNGLSREVLYEELVQRFPQTARELVSFAGLDWEEACESSDAGERAIRTASATQVRRPVYTTSIGRWRSVADHLRSQAEMLSVQIADHEQKLRSRGLEQG